MQRWRQWSQRVPCMKALCLRFLNVICGLTKFTQPSFFWNEKIYFRTFYTICKTLLDVVVPLSSVVTICRCEVSPLYLFQSSSLILPVAGGSLKQHQKKKLKPQNAFVLAITNGFKCGQSWKSCLTSLACCCVVNAGNKISNTWYTFGTMIKPVLQT